MVTLKVLRSMAQWATKMIKGQDHLSYEDTWQDLELFSMEKKRLQGDLIAAFQYLKEV